MNKTIGNYTQQSNRAFPVDCETLDYLAKNQAMAEMLGNIAGDKVILVGCEIQGQNRNEGYAFVRTQAYPNGEVLQFEGGTLDDYLHVNTSPISVTANGTPYPNAYTVRSLAQGHGSEEYQWADFTRIEDVSNRALKTYLDELADLLDQRTAEPVGVIKMWPSATVPNGYLLCDGSTFQADTYPQLATVLGGNQLPDLRGRFVVGYDNSRQNPDQDYDTIGKTGGLPEVTLTVGQMPSHTHLIGTVLGVDGGTAAANTMRYTTNKEKETTATGGGQAHENRPPYYVLAYIIKAK